MPICKNTSELLIWAKNYCNDNKLHIQINVTILNTLIMVHWSHKMYITNKLMTVYLKQLKSHYFTLNLHGTKALKGNLTQLLSKGHMLHTGCQFLKHHYNGKNTHIVVTENYSLNTLRKSTALLHLPKSLSHYYIPECDTFLYIIDNCH